MGKGQFIQFQPLGVLSLKKKNDLYLPGETMVEVIKITSTKNFKKEMKYSEALELIKQRREAGSKDRYVIYQLGFSGFKL